MLVIIRLFMYFVCLKDLLYIAVLYVTKHTPGKLTNNNKTKKHKTNINTPQNNPWSSKI